MNIKRFVSAILFGALLISTVQAPLNAMEQPQQPQEQGSFFTATLRYLAGMFALNPQGANAAGQNIGSFWLSGPDARIVVAATVAIGAYFLFRYMYDQSTTNVNGQQANNGVPVSIFTKFFGLFSAFGLANWVNTQMNQGRQHYNGQQGDTRADRQVGALGRFMTAARDAANSFNLFN